MNTQDFEALREKIEEKKTLKVQLETKIAGIEKVWKEDYQTSNPDDIKKLIEEKESELSEFTRKQEKLIAELEELLS